MSSPAKPSVASPLPLSEGLLLICMVGVELLSVEADAELSVWLLPVTK